METIENVDGCPTFVYWEDVPDCVCEDLQPIEPDLTLAPCRHAQRRAAAEMVKWAEGVAAAAPDNQIFQERLAQARARSLEILAAVEAAEAAAEDPECAGTTRVADDARLRAQAAQAAAEAAAEAVAEIAQFQAMPRPASGGLALPAPPPPPPPPTPPAVTEPLALPAPASPAGSSASVETVPVPVQSANSGSGSLPLGATFFIDTSTGPGESPGLSSAAPATGGHKPALHAAAATPPATDLLGESPGQAALPTGDWVKVVPPFSGSSKGATPLEAPTESTAAAAAGPPAGPETPAAVNAGPYPWPMDQKKGVSSSSASGGGAPASSSPASGGDASAK